MLQIPNTAFEITSLRTSWFGCFRVETTVTCILCLLPILPVPLAGHTACIEAFPEVAPLHYLEMIQHFLSLRVKCSPGTTYCCLSVLAFWLKREVCESWGGSPSLLFLSMGKTQEGGRRLVSRDIFEKGFEKNGYPRRGFIPESWSEASWAKQSRDPAENNRSFLRLSPRMRWELRKNLGKRPQGISSVTAEGNASFSGTTSIFYRLEEGTEERRLVKALWLLTEGILY